VDGGSALGFAEHGFAEVHQFAALQALQKL
jgi:hypothetical protein